MNRLIAAIRALFNRKPPVPKGAAAAVTAANRPAHRAPEDEYAI